MRSASFPSALPSGSDFDAEADDTATSAPIADPLLSQLISYNARRGWLAVQDAFARRMAEHELTQPEFSVMAVVKANPKIAPAALSDALAIAPPNLLTILDRLEKRELLRRDRDRDDKRVQALKLTASGSRLLQKATKTVMYAEADATHRLDEAECETLNRLLIKLYS
ncbi:MarR family winged helix-turn-helix transcriptional regulator [Paraburkholderia sp.]|uniref:MarR family winged helix-turn-helix transcriptional regulator n=1 Tax=Paraburkholderia sp. TaxID=1926495 RepID=UPI0023A6226F|nr:MarR family winged helix-turn-helix transcriptional regulator [Paraburkholderia sp.]MDE1180374.1 MarR family winged helix-turn-helix transcriptional regulator [Paraburkholderia sp.]